jgi:predicted site-specific integrase-resolvase
VWRDKHQDRPIYARISTAKRKADLAKNLG